MSILSIFLFSEGLWRKVFSNKIHILFQSYRNLRSARDEFPNYSFELVDTLRRSGVAERYESRRTLWHCIFSI